MRLETQEILNNWEIWINEKHIMQYNVYVLVDGEEFELYGINRQKEMVSFIDRNSYVMTVPAAQVPYVVIKFE